MKLPSFFSCAALAATFSALTLPSCAQDAAPATNAASDQSGTFPFVIPWNDAAPTLLDLSGLNAKPAGKNGFIVAKGGHFVESNTGQRVRFLGTNMVSRSAFPIKADAEKIAAHLAKYGVNVVRIHYIDQISPGITSLFRVSPEGKREIDPEKLDRLDYLVAQLIRQGIYVNMNLHVARSYDEKDGLPASIKDISFGNRVDHFYAPLIVLQKRYARELLGRTNPYTGRTYGNEPGILAVEINNENSLVGGFGQEPGSGLTNLPEPFKEDLRLKWNAYLRKSYASDAALRDAWRLAATQLGPELLADPRTQGASWKPSVQGGALFHVVNAPASSKPGTIRIVPEKSTGTSYHSELYQNGLDLKSGQLYTVRFMARADAEREIILRGAKDTSPYSSAGLAQAIKLSPAWKEFQFTFLSGEVTPQHTRVGFEFGKTAVPFELAGLSLRSGNPASEPLAEGESLRTASVSIPASPIARHKADWVRFLAQTERDYVSEMKRFLRDEIGVRQPIISSQTQWGGVWGLYREAILGDFVDTHIYFDHPQQSPQAWSQTSGRINNNSLVPSLGSGNTLGNLALQRVAGKPFAVSEYNHPAPNQFQAEAVPLVSSFGAFQDWDAIYMFSHGPYGEMGGGDRISGYFDTSSNPAKWAFMPSAALMFRQGTLPAAPATLSVPIPSDIMQGPLPSASTVNGFWKGQLQEGALFPGFSRRLTMQMGGTKVESTNPVATPNQAASICLEVRDATPGKQTYVASSPGSRVVVGFVGQSRVQAGAGVAFDFGAAPNNFAALTLVSMDGKALATSDKVLLTLASRIENTGQKWADPARPGEMPKYLTDWGAAPTRAWPIALRAEIQTDGPRRVVALDGTGAIQKEVASTYQGGVTRFAIGAQQSLWFAILKPARQ